MSPGQCWRASVLCAMLFAALLRAYAQQPASPCTGSDASTFNVRVDLFASQTGEFTIDGCEGPSPALQLRPGVTYTFLQHDATNVMHPLLFAYAPDGQLAGAPELATPLPPACSLGCDPGVADQAPVFVSDGVAAPPAGDEAAAMNASWAQAREAYVLAFQAPEQAWSGHRYAVQITIPTGSKTARLFYHCGLFRGMSGRIDVAHPTGTRGLNPPPAFDAVSYYERLRSPATGLDLRCGTRGLADAAMMPGMMRGAGMRGMMPRAAGPAGAQASWGMMAGDACGNDTVAGQFATCMAAIEHAMMMPSMMDMMHGGCNAPLALFNKQMIPHHEGAVNMAKAALKLGAGSAGFEQLAPMLRNVVNTQNLQVAEMRDWLRRFDDDDAQQPRQATGQATGGAAAGAPGRGG